MGTLATRFKHFYIHVTPSVVSSFFLLCVSVLSLKILLYLNTWSAQMSWFPPVYHWLLGDLSDGLTIIAVLQSIKIFLEDCSNCICLGYSMSQKSFKDYSFP